MSKKLTGPDKVRQNASAMRALRDATIRAKAMTGAGGAEIAKSVGVSRQTVSKVLNSDEAKALVKHLEGRLYAIADQCVDAIEEAILQKQDPGTASRVAIQVLKSLGAMRDAPIDLNTRSLGIFVIKKLDGTEEHLGVKEEENGN